DDNFVGVGDGAVVSIADDTSDQKETATPTGLRQIVETSVKDMRVVTMRCAPGRIDEHGDNVGIRA
ncbi:MAG: hypothetical protein WBZ15_23980, partial [Mycobacterium sp.]|uniref:hypothetical protein n=1 Tax=Mycobacterium sp. TaxID=1785 RepID=UPI003C32C4BF